MNACQILSVKMQACLDIANNERNPPEARKRCLAALSKATAIAQQLMMAEDALEEAALLPALAAKIILPPHR